MAESCELDTAKGSSLVCWLTALWSGFTVDDGRVLELLHDALIVVEALENAWFFDTLSLSVPSDQVLSCTKTYQSSLTLNYQPMDPETKANEISCELGSHSPRGIPSIFAMHESLHER